MTSAKGKSVINLSLVGVLLLAGICAVFFFGPRQTPEFLSPEEQKIAGLDNREYRGVQELRERFRQDKQTEADWDEVERLMFGKSPVAQSNAFACLFKLKSKDEQRRALALLEKHAASVPADEPLHDLAPDVIEGIASDGFNYKSEKGCQMVRSWSTGVADFRLSKSAAAAILDCEEKFKG